MDRIQKVKAEVKSAIQRKSAYTLPNNPTDSGWKANDIRKAFWQPIIDNTNSAITEIDRVVDEVNGYLNYAVKGLDSIVSVAGSYYHSSTGLIYTLSEEGFVVSGYEGEEVSLAVPAHIYHDGQYVKVVGIAGEAFKGKPIEHIEIPETVETIGDSAFASCMKLATVVFKGILALGSGVFGSTNTVYTVPKEHLTAYQSSLASYVLSVGNQVRGVNTVENNTREIERNASEIVASTKNLNDIKNEVEKIGLRIEEHISTETTNAADIATLKESDKKINHRVVRNTEDIELLKQVAIEKGHLVVTEITEAYENRITANGENIVDGARSILKKVEGNTVACHNLVNFDALNFGSSSVGELLGCTIDFDKKTITATSGTFRFIFKKYDAFAKFFNFKGAGTYRFSWNSTGKKNKCYVYSNGQHLFNVWSSGQQYFTLTQEHIDAMKSIPVGSNISFYIQGTTGDIVNDMQIVEGEEEKPYVPYYTGLKNASFKGITSTGKNLINNPSQHISVANGYYDEVVTNVKLLPNTTYCLSFDYKINSSTDEKPTCDVGYGDTIMRVSLTPNGVPLGSTSGHFSTTFTTPQSFSKVSTQNPKFVARYVRIGTQGNLDAEVSNVQLTFGDTEQDFTPYVESTIELPATVDCGLGTTIDFENRKIINRGKEIVLTGEETIHFQYYEEYKRGAFYWYGSLTTGENRAKYVSTDAVATFDDSWSEQWKDGVLWVGVRNTVVYWVNATNYLGIYTLPEIPTETQIEEAATALKTYLKQRYESGNPVKIRYVASTGTETELDNNATYMTRKDGMETVLGNENREYVNNTLTQEYFEYAGGEEV